MNDIGDNASKDVVLIIERIERLEEEMRREDPNKREARESMVDVYMRAISRWGDTPLGRAINDD